MMATDLYAASNPALSSLILWSFINGFEQEKKGCEFPVLFIPIPLVLSRNIREDFKKTDSTTGLLTWIARNPNILLDTGKRIESTSSITKEAIIFGVTNNILKIDTMGLIYADNTGIKKSKISKFTDERKEMILISKRLGRWCGQLESTKVIFNIMGMSL
ncbi:DUF6521 family protein [Priestia aryabhattai]|uniref:three component ABC system middle component n=1 Tax=Priestia aryabhattai TaxID=412384 RepID=UPI0020422386|nr:three component ABC system middle component [Priestia aryabhattai]MCM2978991.1 DUF6521 family protein [Priestia aryabhattai]